VATDPIDPIFALKRQLADTIVALAHRQPILIAARRFGIDVARMCDLRKGRIARFSVERLIRILATVDRRVTLTIAPTGPEQICWFPKLRARRRQIVSRDRAELRGPL
jgi:predicted XRE-type DNA-binding protein